MAPRSFDRQSGPMRVVSVASLELPNKGVDVLIDAAATCIQQGSELELVFIGDGRCRSEYERRVVRRRIGGHVCFLGTIPTGRPVRDQLDRAQLFVLAVKGGDGLPRAMIEAMARGVPCVGSAVAGIPELLPPEDLVPRGDANALARKIREVLNHPERMARMSAANLARAREYGDSVLGVRRREFYVHLRRATQEWLRRVP
jgi:glycosyltransferase involved in cell wall biosynthesis